MAHLFKVNHFMSSVPAKLQAKLENFLATRSESEGGYAPVSSQDERNLHEILNALIAAKFEEDPDGDLPINFVLVNRTREQSFHYRPLPRTPHNDDDMDLKAVTNLLRQTSSNVEIANRDHALALRALEFAMENARDKCTIRYDKTVFEPFHKTKDLTSFKLELVKLVKDAYAPAKQDILDGKYKDYSAHQALAAEKSKEISTKMNMKIETRLDFFKSAHVIVIVHGLTGAPRFKVQVDDLA